MSQPELQTPYSGSILPFSRDEQGKVSFDSDAGILGVVKNAFTLPGDVYTGQEPIAGPDGRTTPEVIGRSMDFAATFSPVNPAVRSGEMVVPGAKGSFKAPKVEPPSADALKAAARDGYEQVRNLGVDYRTSAVNDLSGEIQATLTQDGIIGTLAPKTYSILDQLSASPAGSVASLDGITAARKAFGNAARDFSNPTEQLAAKRAIEAIDGFLSRSDPATVVSGPADKVPALLADANGNYSAFRRSKTLTDLTDAAQLRANAANSGANLGNSTRQRLASLVLGKDISGFSPEEVAALRGVNEGSMAANATRWAGNTLGGGGGIAGPISALVAGTGAAATTGNPYMAAAGIAAPVIGAASKSVTNMLTERALSQVEKSVRKRSPLYEEMLKSTRKVPAAPDKTAAAIRALLLEGLTPNSNGGGGW